MRSDELLEDRVNLSKLTSNGVLLHKILTSERFRRQDCPLVFPGRHEAGCHGIIHVLSASVNFVYTHC